MRAPRLRTKALTLATAVVFLAACAWFAHAADPERRFNRGISSLRANRPEETRYYLAYIEHRPDYQAQASLLRGWLRMQSDRAHEPDEYMAIWADLSDALEVRKYRPLTLALMGRLLYQGGRFTNALDMLNNALAEDPDEIEAHRWLGSALYDVGAWAPAVDHLRRVVEREASNGRVCRLLGMIYQEHSVYGEAAAAYQESLARNPDQPDADLVRLDLARCHIALEDYDAALTALNDAADVADALALRGLCYENEGNRERARQCVDRALEQDAENVAALNCLALIDPSAAVGPLSRAVENRPDDYQLRERLVATCRATGKDELADEHEKRLGDLRKLRSELDTLLLQANDNLFDASLRYRIADVAERLGLAGLANDWRKAANMLESPDAAAAPLPSIVTPPSHVK